MRRFLTAEGPLSIVSDSTQVWWANVGEARFSVDLYQAGVLTEGKRHRVHYIRLPDGAMPLSMEAADPV